MYFAGKKRTVVVDDKIPCRNGKPVFCRNNDGEYEIWPMILEKAWAKVHGSYEMIEGGTAA